MKRVGLVVAYDGTNYCGWQVQPNGITIEQVLNENLSKLLGEEIRVTGASRTDSGVHSMGNVAIFDTETRMPADKISFALNQRLPAGFVRGSARLASEISGQPENIRVPHFKPYFPYAEPQTGHLFLSSQTGCGQNEAGGFVSCGRA